MNKNIIIAILVVIIIAVVGFAVFGSGMGNGKTNMQINFLSENTLQNGEQIQIELKDTQGNALANEIVNFTYQLTDKMKNTLSLQTLKEKHT